MPTILEQIVEQTGYDLKRRKQRMAESDLETLSEFERERRLLSEAIQSVESISIIAEIKKASPSKGIIRPDFNPAKVAAQYQQGGASAISVLTDEPAFKGSLNDLKTASNMTSIPLLRKDFIIDTYQIKEARAYGADAVLLIATIMSGHQLQELHQAAEEYGLECLVECYSEEDLKLIDFEQVKILGVNNRNLHTFEVDLHGGIDKLKSAPEGTMLVSESGISSASDLKLLQESGIHAALIGEYFMKQHDPGKALKQMLDELKF